MDDEVRKRISDALKDSHRMGRHNRSKVGAWHHTPESREKIRRGMLAYRARQREAASTTL